MRAAFEVEQVTASTWVTRTGSTLLTAPFLSIQPFCSAAAESYVAACFWLQTQNKDQKTKW